MRTLKQVINALAFAVMVAALTVAVVHLDKPSETALRFK